MLRLVELEPKWLTIGDRKVGLVFKCPHCRSTWLSCFFEKTPKWKDGDGERFSETTQFGMFQRINEADFDKSNIVPCRDDFAWTRTGDNFESLTIIPSLDCSAAGHWHGFITNGIAR
jgi:hypothetical protein